ncbi:MAG: type II toxin-antitoxin system death-on-curing family toxin [Ruminococcus sp.]|nr:type II toxin-antitoxin system death-on-curing family toxin [Ruminococcus sp.]
MRILNKQQILTLHEMLIEQSGGSPEIRDEGLLESALNAPFQSFGNTELYPSLLEKAARLGFGLIKNHPFVDGNKRIGTHAMLSFLNINNAELDYSDKELTSLILGIAAGEYDDKHLLNWLQQHLI